MSYTPPPTPNTPNNPLAGLSRLSLGRKTLLGSGLALLIFFFFPWYTSYINVLGQSEKGGSISGMSGLGSLAFLVLLVVLAAAAMPLFNMSVKKFVSTPLSEGTLLFYGTIAVAALVLISGLLKSGTGGSASLFGTEVSWSWSIGFFLSILATLGLLAGGWLMRSAGE